KDAALMARLNDLALRREWRRRIEDHDGREGDEGGVERWIKLCEGLGLDRAYVLSERGALPATKFAVEAYVRFVAERSLLEAIASSLTELFAPAIIADRVAGMLANYDYVEGSTLAYFDKRLTQAPQDSTFALNYCKEHAQTLEQQQAVIEALRFKTGLLWSMLDALDYAYGAGPHVISPGAFAPKEAE
ncbi:MAG: pyrroloquinoline-quinone synthase PqqC, partial [Alphaproteobacteria bacterium]